MSGPERARGAIAFPASCANTIPATAVGLVETDGPEPAGERRTRRAVPRTLLPDTLDGVPTSP